MDSVLHIPSCMQCMKYSNILAPHHHKSHTFAESTNCRSRACERQYISWRQNFLRIYGRCVNCERHNFLRKNCRHDTFSGVVGMVVPPAKCPPGHSCLGTAVLRTLVPRHNCPTLGTSVPHGGTLVPRIECPTL